MSRRNSFESCGSSDYRAWLDCIDQFEHIRIYMSRKSSHYHFKRRKDMRLAMRCNYNPYDTFSFASKAAKGKIPTKAQLRKARDRK